MKTATELRDELYEMDVLAGRLAKYSKAELEALIAGIKEKTSRIGEEVKRDTNEAGYQGTGIIIKIEGSRARVHWDNKKTWYRLDKLIGVQK
jgi:hypothetical protein